MQLAIWTYEGPPHVGAMRVATAMKGVHYVLHAPQGDTYADLLFTMIERRGARPPVTYTTFQARDLGKDTAELFQSAARDAVERFQPQALLVGASCTAELIQDDPAGLAENLGLSIPVVPLELPSYSRKESWGAAETFYQIVRRLADTSYASKRSQGRHAERVSASPASAADATPSQETLKQVQGDEDGPAGVTRPTANILGPTALGFRHRDDVAEITGLLDRLGVDVHIVAPLGASPTDIARIGAADFNVLLYPETGEEAARWLERTFGQPFTKTVPIGVGATRDFLREVAALTGLDPAPVLADTDSRMPWWSRSVDSTYLTGKRVFIFGDATHAAAAARIAKEELGFEIAGLGCYNREFARGLRAVAREYGVEPLITDDHLEVEDAIAAAHPELVLGTQMERHIAKRLGIPAAVISAPVHVQDFPARYSPQMGFEGANVIFDDWVHPLVMGLEEHLLTMFRDDFEFHDGAGASHLHGSAPASPNRHAELVSASPATTPRHDEVPEETLKQVQGDDQEPELWTAEAEAELKKIPFFVRGKARRNTEVFAADQGLGVITLDTLYEAKAHYAR